MEAVLFVSRKCQHSMRLLGQYPNMPSQVSVIDVHDPRAHKFLVSYQIQGVPTLVVVDSDGRSTVVGSRSQVARVIEAFQQRGGGQRQQQQPQQQQQQQRQPNLREQYRGVEGIDMSGEFPEIEQNRSDGPWGWNDGGPLLDVGEAYQAPFSSSHSMEAQVRARTNSGQLPLSSFQPPLPPQQPLMPANQTANPGSNDSINTDEMNRKLEEMARMRADYDKQLEARNRAMDAQNRTMR